MLNSGQMEGSLLTSGVHGFGPSYDDSINKSLSILLENIFFHGGWMLKESYYKLREVVFRGQLRYEPSMFGSDNNNNDKTNTAKGSGPPKTSSLLEELNNSSLLNARPPEECGCEDSPVTEQEIEELLSLIYGQCIDKSTHSEQFSKGRAKLFSSDKANWVTPLLMDSLSYFMVYGMAPIVVLRTEKDKSFSQKKQKHTEKDGDGKPPPTATNKKRGELHTKLEKGLLSTKKLMDTKLWFKGSQLYVPPVGSGHFCWDAQDEKRRRGSSSSNTPVDYGKENTGGRHFSSNDDFGSIRFQIAQGEGPLHLFVSNIERRYKRRRVDPYQITQSDYDKGSSVVRTPWVYITTEFGPTLSSRGTLFNSPINALVDEYLLHVETRDAMQDALNISARPPIVIKNINKGTDADDVTENILEYTNASSESFDNIRKEKQNDEAFSRDADLVRMFNGTSSLNSGNYCLRKDMDGRMILMKKKTVVSQGYARLDPDTDTARYTLPQIDPSVLGHLSQWERAVSRVILGTDDTGSYRPPQSKSRNQRNAMSTGRRPGGNWGPAPESAHSWSTPGIPESLASKSKMWRNILVRYFSWIHRNIIVPEINKTIDKIIGKLDRLAHIELERLKLALLKDGAKKPSRKGAPDDNGSGLIADIKTRIIWLERCKRILGESDVKIGWTKFTCFPDAIGRVYSMLGESHPHTCCNILSLYMEDNDIPLGGDLLEVDNATRKKRASSSSSSSSTNGDGASSGVEDQKA